ncbi:MAG: hypothetical protein FVQ79_13910, partial [Planctomycetes bacterium]|nr:hypothetical protein [Planctomycetota bacterium]
DNGAGSTVTSADGAYSITVPNHWDGTVTVSKAGWLITPASKAYTKVSADITNENYIAYQPKISGIVTRSDSTPLAGAAVSAENGGGSGTTDINGYYELYVPYNWTGNVSASFAGYYFADNGYPNVTGDQTSQNFTGFQPTISGSTGVSSATVTVSGIGSFVSTPSYSVVVPYNWSGTVSAEKAGYHFPDSTKSYTNVTSNIINQNFTPYQPRITGTTNVAGATVTVSGIGTITSTPNYSVTVPYGWTGTVTARKLTWNIIPESLSYTNLISDRINQNFTAVYTGIITVKSDGTGDAPTIQAAIDIATDGDIVKVEDGTYTGIGNRNIDFKGKAITVQGNIADPNLVVIDCQGDIENRHRGFKFVSGEGADSTLEGFMITNGYVYSHFEPYGSAIYINSSSPLINKCIITGCYAKYGGGISCKGTNNPTITNCTVSNNTASEIGGGFYGCDGTITNCTVSGNITYNGGGGGFSNCDATIENCTVRGNDAHGGGGGFYNCDGMITNCTVSNNTATDVGGGFSNCDGTIENCTVSGNSATSSGGGFSNCDGTIGNCTVSNNSATSRGGGFSSCGGTIQNCTVSGNSAAYDGGGFYDCGATIQNCTVSGNSAGDGGGGLYNCHATIENCIVWANTAGEYDQIYNSVTPGYSCIQDWTGSGTGNISDDPLFIDAANGDYHLP